MNIKLSQKKIIDLCGMVSFKRGEAFYHSNKVEFQERTPHCTKAIVSGAEEFHVTVEVKGGGTFNASCSCPTLGSFEKKCQHIAAVLIALLHVSENQDNNQENQIVPVEEGWLSLFKEQPKTVSGRQLHFEQRTVLEVEFIIHAIAMGNGQYMFGLGIEIAGNRVEVIRDFLDRVKQRSSFEISPSLIYHQDQHYFDNSTDAVILQLIQQMQDENIYPSTISRTEDESLLLIPPSSWEKLLPMLFVLPSVKLQAVDRNYGRLRISKDKLPLSFYLIEKPKDHYQLEIAGLDRIIIMNAYSTVLSEGILYQLRQEECQRLTDIRKVMDSSETGSIPISQEQVGFFLDKVVPSLKLLGEVHLPIAMTDQLVRTPLIAKLYLDRVKDRLLVGLEFHYENVVINPLEKQTNSLLIRDVSKEEGILGLIEDSELTKTDEGYFLHNEELEYEFLYHVLPKLQNLVQIYATTAVRNRIFREPAKPKILVKVKRERTNWLEFKFAMDGINDKDIRDLLLALEEKRKYYRLRNGSLMSLETREFAEIQRFLQAVPEQVEDLEKGLNVPIVKGLKFLNDVEEDDTFSFEESFRNFLDSLKTPNSGSVPVPKDLEAILRDYQIQGYTWMKTLASFGFGGILADDMGLGKTLQSIAYIVSEVPDIRKRQLPILVVCPSSVMYNWLSELMKFSPEVVAVVADGSVKERQKILEQSSEIDVIITSYPLLRKDIKWYEEQDFHTVFYDEAQAFKNPVTQTARAVKKIRAEHRFALTGTPVENSIEEMWSIFHVIFPELFMGLREYSHLTRKQIARRIRPFLLRRLKEEVLDEIPDKIEWTEKSDLLPEQKKLYAAYLSKLREDTLKHLNKDTLRKNRIKILAGLTRLRQICCHPGLFVDGYKGRSAKFEQLKQMLREAQQSGKRVLIFSQFTKMLNLIGAELVKQGIPYFYLDGQTPAEERVGICENFNAGERDIFLISLKAGGTGLNLTGADTVILYDLWWNPAVEEQAADRAHRMGQKNVVNVIKLVARGTIEEKMNELQEKKRHLIEEILDSEQKAGAYLTEEDIREILL